LIPELKFELANAYIAIQVFYVVRTLAFQINVIPKGNHQVDIGSGFAQAVIFHRHTANQQGLVVEWIG